ncbi:acyltransferase family protein [Zoogloea sp.]|uniref:acyltransferase family protein n=1 Tax=Zoogloea sp. TaxID=49181 RepID=UPI0035B156F6
MLAGFRTDIQALRGLAVSLVLLFHAGLGPFGGGFLGVDIFFVISGFLITGLVRKGIERGDFRFSEFYFRRCKRLLPAAYAVFVLTAVAAPFALTAQEMDGFIRQTLGAVSFTTNMVLFSQAGYFGGAAELKPLLHVWSLSIEEQYYLILPACLVFVPRRFWKAGIVLLCLASMAGCFVLLGPKPVAAFYFLPTRAWELALGSVGALLAETWARPLAQRVLAGVFWPALLVLLGLPLMPTGLPHPGVDALLVCVATLVVILRRHPMFDQLAAARALARVGDVSYSLYLAHWPPFALLKNAAVGPIGMQQNLLTLLVGIGLGLLLYRFVELPTRTLDLRPSRRLVALGLSTSLLVACLPWFISQIPNAGPEYAQIRRPNDGFSTRCRYEDGKFEPLAECRSGDDPDVMVWGDSFAMHLVPGLVAASPDHQIIQATMGNCGPFENLAPLSNEYFVQSWAMSCLEFSRRVMDYLARSPHIRTVVIASPFHQYLKPVDGKHHWRVLAAQGDQIVEQPPGVGVAAEALVATIRHVQALGKKVVLVGPPPSSGFNIGNCLERQARGMLAFGAPMENCSVPVADYRQFFALTDQLLARVVQETGVKLLSFDPLLCDQTRCVSRMDGQLLYVDAGHITHDASRLLVGRLGLAAELLPRP